MTSDEAQPLSLDSGECTTLSPDGGRFQKAFRRVNPRSAAEVRGLLGLTPEAAKALHESGQCCMPNAMPASTPAAEDLDHQDPEIRAAARSATYQAFNAYVRSPNPAAMAHMVPAFDRYLDISKAVINIAYLSDIEVADGATLTISKNTHVVNARRIIIHRTGRIVCHGSTTFRVTSVEGLRRQYVSVNAVAAATVAMRDMKN